MTPDKAPREHQNPPSQGKKGLVLIFTGEGKGKSTAAFGTVFRALGQGLKVGVVQFIKGPWQTGEKIAAEKWPGQLDWHTLGAGFTWDTKDREKDLQTARAAWKKCLEFLHDPQHDLVVFDEIIYCLEYDFLSTPELIAELRRKPAMKHVILTGRGASPELIEAADLVTEMKNLKHPYQKGILAQPGIDF